MQVARFLALWGSKAALKAAAGAEGREEIEGLFQEHYDITVHERIYVETLHRQAKYRLKSQYRGKHDKETIITAPGPAKVRPGTKHSIDFALEVVRDRYEYHTPL